MELKDFIGKTVIRTSDKKRFFITEITSPEVNVQTVQPDARGHHACYSFKTINGDPISNGYLVFEDASLTEPFQIAFKAYSRTKDAYWEEYGYWMRKD